MKKLLQIILIVALFAIAFHFRFQLHDKFKIYIDGIKQSLNIGRSINPCLEPLPYALGTFDTKFGISKEYFLSALSEAEAIWEKPLGKNFFDYADIALAENGMVTKVNLIYDYRQQATSTLKSLGIEVDNTKASYESLKSKLDILKAEYDREISALNIRVAAFNAKQAAYEKEVNYWNAKGGAPEKEFNKLESTRRALDVEVKKIQSTQNNLDKKVEEINALVVVVNRLIGTLNLSVEKYNTTNESRGESFEEGVYTTDGVVSQIDIYEFSNREKLVRVLAHEFGHALGLDHLSDKEAIMYEFNQGDALKLSEADIKAIKDKCGI